MECVQCREKKNKDMFSKTQQRTSRSLRKCKDCAFLNYEKNSAPGPNYERNQFINYMRDNIEPPDLF